MHLADAPGQGQAQTTTFFLGADKGREKPFNIQAQTRTFIADLDLDSLVLFAGGDVHQRAWSHRIKSIFQQIDQHLLDLVSIHRAERQGGWDDCFQSFPFLVGAGAQERHHGFQHRGQAHRIAGDGALALKIQQILHQTCDSIDLAVDDFKPFIHLGPIRNAPAQRFDIGFDRGQGIIDFMRHPPGQAADDGIAF